MKSDTISLLRSVVAALVDPDEARYMLYDECRYCRTWQTDTRPLVHHECCPVRIAQEALKESR